MSEKNGLPLDIALLEERIGYKFRDASVIATALTHSSYSNEVKLRGQTAECNERLEFLGDSVLSLITTRYLYTTYTTLPEGEMSKIRAAAVCEKALHGFAGEIGLGNFLYLGHGEELNRGRTRASILADAFEALLAAMYLDGGLDAVSAFLMPLITEEVDSIVATGRSQDYKTELQQIIQQDKDELLEYVTVGESGPAHKRIFDVEARLNGNVIGRGSGTSKRNAEQDAAKEALSLFGIKEEK